MVRSYNLNIVAGENFVASGVKRSTERTKLQVYLHDLANIIR
jgi:hypothetical protein